MDEVKRTYISIILDRSGSMKYSRKVTIDGFNKKVAAIRKEAEGEGIETYVSFYTFNHKVEPHYQQMSVNFLQELTDEDYVCEGDTAMYEGVGTAITNLIENTKTDDPNNTYLVFVFSDGRNNRTPETHKEQYKWSQKELAELIQKCLDSKQWTFSYMGANQDLSKVATELNIPAGSIANYSCDLKGSQVAWAASNRQTEKFLKMRKVGGQHFNCSKNFHSDSDEIADYSTMSLEDVKQDKKAVLEDDATNRAKVLFEK